VLILDTTAENANMRSHAIHSPPPLRGGETGLVRKRGSGIHSPWNRPWTTPESAQIPETSAAPRRLVRTRLRTATDIDDALRDDEHARAIERLLSYVLDKDGNAPTRATKEPPPAPAPVTS